MTNLLFQSLSGFKSALLPCKTISLYPGFLTLNKEETKYTYNITIEACYKGQGKNTGQTEMDEKEVQDTTQIVINSRKDARLVISCYAQRVGCGWHQSVALGRRNLCGGWSQQLSISYNHLD